MDWIWDNFQLILVVAGAIAVWLNNRRREQAGKPADYDEDGRPDNRTPRPGPLSRDDTHPDEAERVRRIQEEIRRKIAERRGQSAPPPMPAPVLPMNPLRPVFREQPPAPAPVQRPAPPPMPVVREVATVYDDEAALERQRRLAEQLAELEARRREVRQTAVTLAEAGPVSAVSASARERTQTIFPHVQAGVHGLAAELRNPKALRRAMVLREVLDPPIALRRI